MEDASTPAPALAEPHSLAFDFRGKGSEFFRIWIVNIALTLLTLGVYGAWAKVRTQRYFYGNTYVDGHAFDYHASPWRILLGRIIALSLLLAYSITTQIYPVAIFVWYLIFAAFIPWLINSSLRFISRNSSYRNIRFNFTGAYVEGFIAYVLWPMVGFATVGLLYPRARKARDYYYVNHHTYGGRLFETEFSTARIYLIYVAGLGILFGTLIGGSMAAGAIFAAVSKQHSLPDMNIFAPLIPILIILASFAVYSLMSVFIDIMVFNLSLNNTVLDKHHKLRSRVSPWRMAWIRISNTLLILLTIGFFYPWARVRAARYQMTRLAFIATTSLDEFTADVTASQSAIGEEVAGFFDLGIGL
jgi:uncharacterized membrane protein YjgN (DUF898 family)